MKTCKSCGTDKSENEFYKHTGLRGGLKNQCKACHSDRHKAKRIALRASGNQLRRFAPASEVGIGIAKRRTKTDKPCLYCKVNARYRFGRCKDCYYKRLREKTAERKAAKVCAECGKSGISGSKFCSQKCSQSSRWKRVKVQPASKQRVCVVCGIGFMAKKLNVRSCSPKCRSYLMGRRDVGQPAPSGYRGYKWRDKAKAVFAGDKGKCQGMACLGVRVCRNSVTLHCDHIVPYHLGLTFEGFDPNTVTNLITLCDSCHAKKTTAERKLFKGNVVGFLADARRLFMDLGRVKKALILAGMMKAEISSAEKFLHGVKVSRHTQVEI